MWSSGSESKLKTMDKVTRDNPCPVCGRHDGCLVAEDGTAALCSRTESDKLCGQPFGGGWLHKLTGDPVPVRRRPKPTKKKQPVPDFFRLTDEFQEAMFDDTLYELAKDLGVQVVTLKRLQVGRGFFYAQFWQTFPMRDGLNKIIGIRLRSKSHKFGVPGSKNGLFWPVGVKADSREPTRMNRQTAMPDPPLGGYPLPTNPKADYTKQTKSPVAAN